MVFAHIDVDVSGALTLGDVIVGAGTIALATFTARLANATYKLDRRNAARERKRRERQVRGVARLVDGELELVQRSIEQAIDGRWEFTFAAPHGAWDKDGAIIVETVAQDDAIALIEFFSKLVAWETTVRDNRRRSPGATGVNVSADPERQTVYELQRLLSAGRVRLGMLAYPDARDLEPDPDDELEYRQRQRWRWLRIPGRHR